MKTHFCASAFVINPLNKKILLVKHHLFNKWVQPGGHIEENELPEEAAIREVYEETGVKITLLGERFPREDDLIRPLGIQCERKKDDILITLDPGSAFGTGTHATTQLCIQAIEKYLKKGDEVADIGTGSGILAITAIKFGAVHAIAIDNDPLVIDVAKDNAQMNCVFNKIDFMHATADMLTEQYDFVCANILHNVLAEIMGDLKNIMKPSGYMVLSGILDEKKPVVLEAIEKHNLKLVETMNQEQWVALVVQKV